MTVLDKLKRIEKAKTIYNIHYCNAGVGFQFYECPDSDNLPYPVSGDWKQYLKTYRYYTTFEKAVSAEYRRLKAGGKQ
jgi:hypothetical protein